MVEPPIRPTPATAPWRQPSEEAEAGTPAPSAAAGVGCAPLRMNMCGGGANDNDFHEDSPMVCVSTASSPAEGEVQSQGRLRGDSIIFQNDGSGGGPAAFANFVNGTSGRSSNTISPNDDLGNVGGGRPTTSQPPATAGRGEDVSQIVLKAKRAAASLWLILHAQTCALGNGSPSTPTFQTISEMSTGTSCNGVRGGRSTVSIRPRPPCPHKGCDDMKRVLHHVRSCPASFDELPCPTGHPGCQSVRKLLNHYKKCRAIRQNAARARRLASSGACDLGGSHGVAPQPVARPHVCLVCSLVARHVRTILEGGRAPLSSSPAQEPRSPKSPHRVRFDDSAADPKPMPPPHRQLRVTTTIGSGSDSRSERLPRVQQQDIMSSSPPSIPQLSSSPIVSLANSTGPVPCVGGGTSPGMLGRSLDSSLSRNNGMSVRADEGASSRPRYRRARSDAIDETWDDRANSEKKQAMASSCPSPRFDAAGRGTKRRTLPPHRSDSPLQRPRAMSLEVSVVTGPNRPQSCPPPSSSASVPQGFRSSGMNANGMSSSSSFRFLRPRMQASPVGEAQRELNDDPNSPSSLRATMKRGEDVLLGARASSPSMFVSVSESMLNGGERTQHPGNNGCDGAVQGAPALMRRSSSCGSLLDMPIGGTNPSEDSAGGGANTAVFAGASSQSSSSTSLL